MTPPIELMNTISKPAIASPRTNLLAPSMAPKKALSSSRALRRSRACCSLISPEERSASIAICLPGMASKVKRAATSAMRVEPRVMTTKFTITRIANTMMPITNWPPITKLAKAKITSPAACSPEWPPERIRRVEAMLSERRNSVVSSKTDGKDVNSSGFLMSSAVTSTNKEIVIEIDNSASSKNAGSGTSMMARMASTPAARAISPRNTKLRSSPISNGAARSGCAASVMLARYAAWPVGGGGTAAPVSE